MNQECQFCSTTQNYFVVLQEALNGSLSEQEREAERERERERVSAKGPAEAFSIYG